MKEFLLTGGDMLSYKGGDPFEVDDEFTTGILLNSEIPNSLCFSTWELRSLPKQWTYGPTLMSWRYHLHTALRLF